jgi:enoyl-[acyl-carrier-protein] reductase (NADH)
MIDQSPGRLRKWPPITVPNWHFTYQGDALRKRVEPLAQSVGSNLVMPCDVTNDGAVDETFDRLSEHWDRIDFVLHAIAYSDKDELKANMAIPAVKTFCAPWISHVTASPPLPSERPP